MKSKFVVIGIAMALCMASTAFSAQETVVVLTNGTQIHGTLIEQTDASIRVLDPVLGEITIPRTGVLSVTTSGAAPQAPPAPAPAQAPAPAAEEPPTDETLIPRTMFQGWGFEAEAGLNGSDGNTEEFNLRAGLSGERDTERAKTELKLSYKYGTSDGERSEDRFKANARNDWKLDDPRWRYFVEGEVIRDDFQDWDWQYSIFTGIGYAFIDNDETFFLGRIGGGITQQIGGEDEDIIPEGLLGLEFDHKLTENSQFESQVDYFPNLEDPSEYRVVASAAYSVLVDPELNMSLKLGIENRYDSMPGGDAEKNDIDYFMVLVWSF